MRILNLGCGTKTCEDPIVVNIDWSIYLRIKRNKVLNFILPMFLTPDRLQRYRQLPLNILVYNLKKGIPFENESIDVVYHSHLLEHIDRPLVENFLLEVKRVLKVGGIQRIVLPDFERLAKSYLNHLLNCETLNVECDKHDTYIEQIIEQSVRKESYGTSKQKWFRRIIENFLLGDARERGETHQWLYDRFNLKSILLSVGFKEVYFYDFNSSSVPHLINFGFDTDEQGNEYKPGSLYIETIK